VTLQRENVNSVRIELLDGFRVLDQDRLVNLPSGPSRLLAFLAISGQPMRRPYVASQLWGDVSERSAGANLRSVIWQLKQRCSTALQVDRTMVGLSTHTVIDLREVAAQARGITTEDDYPIEEVQPVKFARTLLPAWYEEWVVYEQIRVRLLFLHALERLAERLADAGRIAEGIDTCLAAIQMDPMRETAWCQLMELQLREGNRSEVLRSFGTYREMMQNNLGLEPSERARHLVALAKMEV
jgi:DNA-binding SARP family transcriptional activator